MDRIEGTVTDGHDNAIGKGIQQVSVYADAITWREFIRRDIEAIHKEIDDLQAQIRELAGRVMFLLIIVLIMFLVSAVATAFTIRQFDNLIERINTNDRQLDQMDRRLERQYYPPGVP